MTTTALAVEAGRRVEHDLGRIVGTHREGRVALRQLDRGQGKDLHSPGAHEEKSLHTFREESMHDRAYAIGISQQHRSGFV